MAKYSVVRTDLMSGTKQPADMVSLRFYNGNDLADVENGVIAELIELEDGEREVWKAKAATSSSKLEDCVLIATPEIMYDEHKRALSDFINEAGVAARGYRLRDRNMFSLTAEGFDGTAPTKGQALAIGANGKLKAGTTAGFGKCVHIEDVGADKFYAIQIQLPASE